MTNLVFIFLSWINVYLFNIINNEIISAAGHQIIGNNFLLNENGSPLQWRIDYDTDFDIGLHSAVNTSSPDSTSMQPGTCA